MNRTAAKFVSAIFASVLASTTVTAAPEIEEKEKPVEVKVDFDGIQDRVVALPTDPAVIRSFATAKGFLYYSTVPVQGLDGPLPESHDCRLEARLQSAPAP